MLTQCVWQDDVRAGGGNGEKLIRTCIKTAVDDIDGVVNVSINDQSINRYVPGSYEVIYTATDTSGNTAQLIRIVNVEDTMPPVLTVTLDSATISSPNHKMVDINATVDSIDSCDVNPSIILSTFSSNESNNEKGDGNTINDMQGIEVGTADTIPTSCRACR